MSVVYLAQEQATGHPGRRRGARRSTPWFYAFKRLFWGLVVRRVIEASAPIALRAPEEEDLERLRLIPASDLRTTMRAMHHVQVTRSVPVRERSVLKELLLGMTAKLAGPLNLRNPGLPRIRTGVTLEELDAATAQNLADCYPPSWDGLLDVFALGKPPTKRPPPAAPPAFRRHPEDLVGALALAGPFAAILKAVPDQPG